jgi:hypothetical protein
MSEREDRCIEHALKQNTSAPLPDITNIITLPISERTVCRRQSEMGLGDYVAVAKPGLLAEVVKRSE